MTMYKFNLPKIETRTKEISGVKSYIIKGYATVPNHIYSYGGEKKADGSIRSFREYFTDDCVANINRKAKMTSVFADMGHQIVSKFGNIPAVFEQIQQRTGLDLSEEKNYVLSRIKSSDVPMFKVQDVMVDDKGLFVDIRGNPFYRDIDAEHQKYFDAVWASAESGFINGMSLNFKATDVTKINEGLNQINDVDMFGISLDSGVANDLANITEVAVRCMNEFKNEVRGEKKCQIRKMVKTSLML